MFSHVHAVNNCVIKVSGHLVKYDYNPDYFLSAAKLYPFSKRYAVQMNVSKDTVGQMNGRANDREPLCVRFKKLSNILAGAIIVN